MAEADHYMDIEIQMKDATYDTNFFQHAAAGYSLFREDRGQLDQQDFLSTWS